MYTQCPECQTAFRITATVLKQAAGRVRCGGCGKAFNAVEHLSEEPPRVAAAGEAPAERQPPSRELLDTLDRLAGSDEVRIEDTGIEWRVLGDEEAEDSGVGVANAGDTAAHRMIDTQTALEFDDSSPPDDELRYDDNTPLPDDFGDADIAGEATPAPRRRADDFEEPPTAEFVEAQHDLELSEPEEWAGLLSEMDAAGVDDGLGVDETATAEDDAEDDGDESLSIEVEEELAAIHTELSFRPSARESSGRYDRDRDSNRDDEQVALLGPDEIDNEDAASLDPDEQAFDFTVLLDGEGEKESARHAGAESMLVDGGADRMGAELAQENDDDTGQIEFEESTGEFRAKIAEAEFSLKEYEPRTKSGHSNDERTSSTDDEDEREKTVNLQIDEELLRAMEDQDFAATMISEDGSPLVETIIMEGEFIRGSIEAEQKAAENSARHRIPEGTSLADTYMLNREKEKSRFRFARPGKGLVAGILLLLVLLAGQYVHNTREWLATFGTFNQTLGPVYRTLGSPVRPRWDIKGWQFETTSGSTDETGATLTIQSRISNRSESALPYPLVHISLTDRWEETIGSRVLEPNEYLAGNADPRRPLAPGERFTAVITIESPSPDATGFKLNVCYRESPGVVRCAIEDFKD